MVLTFPSLDCKTSAEGYAGALSSSTNILYSIFILFTKLFYIWYEFIVKPRFKKV